MRIATQTRPSPSFQRAVERLAERATSATSATERSQWLRWLLAAGAVFLIWKVWRGFKSLFWTVFGLGMALYWSGAWHRWM
jgi:hypothetical protein